MQNKFNVKKIICAKRIQKYLWPLFKCRLVQILPKFVPNEMNDKMNVSDGMFTGYRWHITFESFLFGVIFPFFEQLKFNKGQVKKIKEPGSS